MTGRTEQLEPAIRAQGALIAEAQREVERYLAKESESAKLVDQLIKSLDGPLQRRGERACGQDAHSSHFSKGSKRLITAGECYFRSRSPRLPVAGCPANRRLLSGTYD
jgi:hypothetical protein